ncbi:MAG: GTP-binding protein, partial [Candidatus Poseidoniales archaeon]
MVLYIIDPFHDTHLPILHRELELAGMRLNQPPPQVFITRLQKGGVEVRSTVEQTHLTVEHMRDIIRSFGYTSALVTLRVNATADMLVDTMAGSRVYSKAVVIINKIDLATPEDLANIRASLPEGWPVLPISAVTGEGIEEMKDFIYDNLGFMSIYLKPQGQEADLIEPLIVKDTSTVQ